jgi:hypothetical protein
LGEEKISKGDQRQQKEAMKTGSLRKTARAESKDGQCNLLTQDEKQSH